VANSLPTEELQLRSKQEIVERCREIIHRARRRFLKKNSRPCPLNCQFATQRGNEVTGCSKCKSYDIERCMRPEEFSPFYTKEELYQQFREELYDRQILFRKYPAIGVLLWVLGVVRTAEDEVQIDTDKIKDLEKHHVNGR
jgi:hypothetical protein